MQISFILLTFVLKNCRLFIACKIGKQCKPVQVHPFSRFSLCVNLRKLLVGDPQSPLNGICDTGYSFILNAFVDTTSGQIVQK